MDPWFIVSGDPEHAQIIKLARQVNDSKPKWVVKKIINRVEALVNQGIAVPKVACLGLAFKPDIDDLRESPSVEVARSLLNLGITVIAVEPNIQTHDNFTLCSFQDALDADLLVLLVKHKEFLVLENRKKLLDTNVLDFCGVLV